MPSLIVKTSIDRESITLLTPRSLRTPTCEPHTSIPDQHQYQSLCSSLYTNQLSNDWKHDESIAVVPDSLGLSNFHLELQHFFFFFFFSFFRMKMRKLTKHKRNWWDLSGTSHYQLRIDFRLRGAYDFRR